MARWFWYFLFYGFLGYCLERLFARAIHSERQVRKCFLLLPVCPVYGLAMAAVLALVPADMPFPVLAVLGGMLCTAVEYMVHLFYDKVFRVQFWDYSQLRGSLRGRVCPQFASVWGILSAAALRWVQPMLADLAGRIPAAVTYGVWLVLAADCVLTGALLRQYRDTELLTLPAALAQARASSQSSTSR